MKSEGCVLNTLSAKSFYNVQKNQLQEKLNRILSQDVQSEEDQIKMYNINKQLTEMNDNQTKDVMAHSRARGKELHVGAK